MEFKVTLFMAVLAGSCLMFANPTTAATADLTNPGDYVQRTVAILESGSDNTANMIEVFKQAVKTVDETIRKAAIKMQEITEQIGSVGREANEITNDAFKKYDGVRRDVRAARRKLRSLADKTKTACEDVELYLEGWDNEVDNGEKRFYLKEQLSIMERLVVESIVLLTEAEEIYESAIDNIDGVNTKLRDFSREMKKMLDTSSEKHKKWVDGLRTGVYVSAGTVSVGLLVADVFGCLGICSAVGTTTTWGTAIPVVEASIATVTATLEELEALGESVIEDVNAIKNTTQYLINGLENELSIVSDWKNDAEKMDEKLDTLDLYRFEKMSLYRASFEKKVVALRESAEDYLNQPVELFVQDPTELRKRSLSEKTLVRNHRRNF